jgi:hypothetical protein
VSGNEDFGFDPPGLIDPFFYLGNFWHYAEHLPRFDGDYKISRLPWVLPGFVAQALGGTIVGTYVLDYLAMAGGGVTLYLLIRDAAGDRTTAAVVATAWACYTWGHGVGGWNYHLLATGAYYLAACWLMLRAAKGPAPGGPALLAGAFFAAAVHTHLFMVVFTPLLALLYWAALPPALERRFVRSGRHAALFGVGALTLTMLLMALNGGTGGHWLFFRNQIHYTLRLAQSGNSWWAGDPLVWVPAATYLVIPVLFTVTGLTLLGRRVSLVAPRLTLSLVAQAWVAFAILCSFQFGGRQTILDSGYGAFVANFHAFPCVAAALTPWGRADARVDSFRTAAVSAIVMLGTLLLLLPTPLPGLLRDAFAALGLVGLPPAGPPLVMGILGAAAMLMFRGSARLLTFALWFTVVNAWIAPDPFAYGIGTPGSRQQMVALFRDADRFTAELDPTLVGIKYWFREEETAISAGRVQLNDVFDSFVSTRGWMANLLAERSPGLPIDLLTAEHLDAATCIGVLSSTASQDRLKEELSAHFERLGRPLGQVASRRFERPQVSFALTVFKSLSKVETLPPCYSI